MRLFSFLFSPSALEMLRQSGGGPKDYLEFIPSRSAEFTATLRFPTTRSPGQCPTIAVEQD